MDKTIISTVRRADGSTEESAGGSTGIWDKIFNNAGGWISSISGGISSIVQAKTGNYPTYQQDNTPKVLAIAGVVAVVLIIILVIIFKK